MRPGTSFDYELIDSTDSSITLQISGKNAENVFKNESGGHRWQRIPPTERKGRVHTSTITVSIMKEHEKQLFKIDEKDLQISKCRGSGAGGQHRNTTDSTVQIKHIPTGIIVRCESERSQHQNKDTAMKILYSRLMLLEESLQKSKMSNDKKQQVGSGMRGDKRRTIRQQDGQVNDHVTGATWRYEDYVKGIW